MLQNILLVVSTPAMCVFVFLELKFPHSLSLSQNTRYKQKYSLLLHYKMAHFHTSLSQAARSATWIPASFGGEITKNLQYFCNICFVYKYSLQILGPLV